MNVVINKYISKLLKYKFLYNFELFSLYGFKNIKKSW